SRLLELRAPRSFPTRRSSDLSHAVGVELAGLVRRTVLGNQVAVAGVAMPLDPTVWQGEPQAAARPGRARLIRNGARHSRPRIDRSEEHTSELQSQSNLVCRLL